MPVQLPEGSVHALSLQFGGLLVFARFLPMTLLLPGVGGLQIALAARIGLAVVLSCLVAPLVVSAAWVAPLWEHPWSALGESAFRGAAVGVTIRLLVASLGWAGDWISDLMGITPRESLPAEGFQDAQSPLGKLHGWLGLLIFWGIGGIPMAVDATLHSFQGLPLVHEPQAAWSFASLVVGVLQQATELAVRVGSPVCLSLVAANLALALIQRSLPHWNVGSVHLAGQWIVLWVALLLTVGSHSDYVTNQWLATLSELGHNQVGLP